MSLKQINYINKKILTVIKCSDYIFNWGGTYGINRAIFRKDEFLPLKEVLFEGNIYKVPGKYEIYLKTMYGDHYMEEPPVEKRISHNLLSVVFDTGSKNEQV
jgi:lipopolysaccharide cholinephosphotransferase